MLLADHALVVIARDDDYTFGVLHSRVHELWARAQGTQLREVESGFRYTPTTTFETFPFPNPGRATRESRGGRPPPRRAARRLAQPTRPRPADLEKRTLTNLYNQRPTWLDHAHVDLDAAVLDAYGWQQRPTDIEILEGLLELNLGEATAQ